MKKVLKNLIVCALLAFSLFLSACPKETALRKAAKASFELSGLTRDVIAATGKAYANNLISLETKDNLANLLKKLSVGGQRYNQALELAIKEFGENVPPDRLQLLSRLFSDEVVTPFLEILQQIKAVSPTQAAYLHSAVAALRTAVLIISGGFSAVNLEIKPLPEVKNYV